MTTQTVTTKICSKCGEEKSLEMFYRCVSKKDGRLSRCKLCQDLLVKLAPPKSPEKIKEYKIRYNSKNVAKIKEYSKEYYQRNKEKEVLRNKNYYKKSGKSILLKRNIRRTIDSSFTIKIRLGNCIRDAFRRYSSNGKVMSSKKYGIDYNEIFQKLGEPSEGNFHIDHIIPISVFNLDNPEHVRLAHHPENLRWLDAIENIQKSNSIDWSLIESNEVLSNIAKEIGLVKE